MTTQTLTPTQLVPDGGGLNVTALLAAATGVTLQFANTGREFLVIVSSTTTTTVTVDVESQVLGQPVTAFTAVPLTENDVYIFGQFHSALESPGGNSVTVTLNAITDVTLALLQNVGVF